MLFRVISCKKKRSFYTFFPYLRPCFAKLREGKGPYFVLDSCTLSHIYQNNQQNEFKITFRGWPVEARRGPWKLRSNAYKARRPVDLHKE